MNYFVHVTVLGARISVQNIPNTTGAVTPAYWNVLVTDDATLPFSSVFDVMEGIQNSSMHTIAANSSSLLNNDSRPIVKYFNTKKFFGKNTSVVGDSLYRGDSASSPVEQAFFHVVCTAILGNDPGVLNFSVMIDYLVVFTEPRNLPIS